VTDASGAGGSRGSERTFVQCTRLQRLERATGVEPATSTLAKQIGANELPAGSHHIAGTEAEFPSTLLYSVGRPSTLLSARVSARSSVTS
jgi:hypothetical protein